MKKIISIISVLVAAASLTACRENSSSAGNIAENSNVSQSTTSSQSSTAQQSTASYEEPPLSNDQYLDDLKGEDLIAKFEWLGDDPISIEDMTVQRITTTDDGDVYNDIELSELSSKFKWRVFCDCGYLAVTPENGEEYVYKKYKAGDRIGNFIVTYIQTTFCNIDYFKGYLAGVTADFEGEAVLIGEVYEPQPSGELYFYPDEESRKRLPIVNFVPKLGEPFDEFFSYDNLRIKLGCRADYPELDLKDIPEDGTRVKVKLKINDYSYSLVNGFACIGSSKIVGDFEIL